MRSSDYEEFLSELEKRKSNIEYIMSLSITKDKDPQIWMVKSLWNLLDICEEVNQMGVPDTLEDDGFSECSKVIRSRRLIPLYYLSYENITPVFLGGVFFKMPGLLLSKKISSEIGYYYNPDESSPDSRKMIDPSKYGLSELAELYDFGTGRVVLDGRVFILKKVPRIKNILYQSSCWEFVDLRE